MDQKGKENIISEPEIGHIPHSGGLGCALFEKMRENQDKVAQINGLTGEEESYRSLLLKSIRTAIKMRSKGINQKDIITICSITRMEICVPYIASIFLGVIPSTLDPSLSVSDMVHLIKQVKPKLLFVGEEAVKIMEDVLKEASFKVEMVVFGPTSIYTPFSEFLEETSQESDYKPIPTDNLKETVAILFSSGTSGLPKGICLTHQGFLLQCSRMGKLPGGIGLTFGSFYWVSSVSILIGSALKGASRIVVPKFDLHGFWKLVGTYKPTMLFLSPSLVADILKVERPETVKNLSLKLVILSGGPISEKHIRGFQKIVPEAGVILAYAQTEITGLGTFFKLDRPEEIAMWLKKPTSSGTVAPGFSMKIVDIETEEILGPNQRGELRIKSDCIMNGYYNIDSSDTFDSDGWLRTGDIAYYDEDRCFFIVDRFKEVLKYRSFQLVPAVLERILLQHPAVEGAVVFGIPHEEDGDHPMALVVISQNFKGISPEEIKKFVEEKVSDAQKLRGGVKIVEKIPLTITGKVKRRELRDKVIRGEL